MSLHGFRKSKEPRLQRPLDVRTFHVTPEAERAIPYPIPAELEKQFTEKEWQRWTERYQEYIDDGCFTAALDLAFYLKVLAPERLKDFIKPEHQTLIKEQLIDPSIYLLFCYCYLFSETPEDILPQAGPGFFQVAVEEIKRNGRVEDLAYMSILYPDLSSPEVLETFWEDCYTHYKNERPDKQLNLAAHLRILYPGHLKELGITKEKGETLEAFELVHGYALLKILAQPEIPGLTTWPPKNTGEEHQLGDETFEQPQTLNL